MANTLLPIEERNLTPDQVEQLDRRRRRGQLFLVLCFQTLIIGTLVTLWAGQDWTLSPGWTKPMVYWDAIMFTLSLIFGVAGCAAEARKQRVHQLLTVEGPRRCVVYMTHSSGGGGYTGVLADLIRFPSLRIYSVEK